MRVRSRRAARNAALSVRASRMVESRARARGWSTTRTSMEGTLRALVSGKGRYSRTFRARASGSGAAGGLARPGPAPVVLTRGAHLVLAHRVDLVLPAAGGGPAADHDLGRRGV